jgi:hypothetical protein
MLKDLSDLQSDTPDHIGSLDTPCLLLDRGRLDADVRRLRERLSGFGVSFRSHLKTAKSVDVARRVMPTAVGPATVSTLREAEVFGRAGVTDMIYAVGIAPSRLERILKLRRVGIGIAVVLDSLEQARTVSDISRAAQIRIPALIEIDCDGHRSGLLPDNARDLVAIGTMLCEGAELGGILTHGVRGVAELEACAERERAAAVQAAEILRAAGLPSPVVSVGPTPTALYRRDYADVTEVRAGVFMFFDLVCAIKDIALSVRGNRASAGPWLADHRCRLDGHVARLGRGGAGCRSRLWCRLRPGWPTLSRSDRDPGQPRTWNYRPAPGQQRADAGVAGRRQVARAAKSRLRHRGSTRGLRRRAGRHKPCARLLAAFWRMVSHMFEVGSPMRVISASDALGRWPLCAGDRA